MSKISSTIARGHFLGQTSFLLGLVILLYLFICLVFLVNKLLNLGLNLEFLLSAVWLGLYLTFILAPIAILTGILSRYFIHQDQSAPNRSRPKQKYLPPAIGITSGLAYYVYLIVTLHISGLL